MDPINIIAEAEEVTNKIGYYIPPNRLYILLDTAAKIAKILASIPSFTATGKEYELVLDIVRDTIKKSREE